MMFDDYLYPLILGTNSINFFCLSICLNLSLVAVTQNIIFQILSLSISSIFISILYLLLDAPDVAMTESALGAGLTTVIFLYVFRKVESSNFNSKDALLKNALTHKKSKIVYFPFFICSILFIIMIIGLYEIGDFGKGNLHLTNPVSLYYIDNIKNDIGIDSYVAAILASYRGFDTLYETCVIFLAGMSVMLILGRNKYYDKE